MDDSRQHPIDQLAEAFVERYRRGECPSLDELIAEHPGHEAEIRNLFPALLAMERLAPSGSAVHRKVAMPQPEQLGDYQIIREVGRGGMGVVYEAIHRPLNRHVALKVLPTFVADKPTVLKRFLREATAAGMLHHAHIVPVFDVGQSDGLHYYSMQFVPGHSLAEVISQLRVLQRQGIATRGRFFRLAERATVSEVAEHLISGEVPVGQVVESKDGSAAGSGRIRGLADESSHGRSDLSGSRHGETRYWRNVARIGEQLATALQFAHDQGIVHRDVKPSNILLDPSGAAWITDFGLASAGDHDLTDSGTLLGTLRFMAPEQLRGWADPRTDVYGLGLTLYELLTLRPAFTANDRAELLTQIGGCDPAAPRKVDRTVPADLETIVLTAIDKEPARRYQTAGALADELGRFLDHKPIHAKRTSTVGRFTRWCRRNPAIASLMAVAAFLVVLLAAGGWMSAARLASQTENLRRRSSELASEKRHAVERLLDATINEARAARNSPGLGRRIQTLDAVRRATALVAETKSATVDVVELRSLAVAAMTFADARIETVLATEEVADVDFSPDLSVVACAIPPDKLVLRRVEDNRELLSLDGPSRPADTLLFSPDSTYLAVAFANAPAGERLADVWVWDWRSGKVVVKATGTRTGYAFSPDSSAIAIAQLQDTVQVYDLPSGATRYVVRTGADPPYARFRPGHSTLAVSSRKTPVVRCFDAKTGEERNGFTLPNVPDGFQWSPHGRYAAYRVGNEVALWDADASRHAGTCVGHRNLAWPQDFAPDGGALMTRSRDGRTMLWDVRGCRRLLAIPGNGIRWSSDGRRFAVFEPVKRAVVYRAFLSDELWRFDSLVAYPALAVAPGTRLLAVGGHQGLCLIDPRSHDSTQLEPIGRCESVAFHPSGTRLVATSPRGLLCWELVPEGDGAIPRLGDSRVLAPSSLNPIYQRLAVDADGERLAYTSTDHQVRVVSWEDTSQTRDFELASGSPGIENIALSGDGRWVAAITAGTPSHVYVWDTATGETVYRAARVSGYGSLAFSPDGRRFLIRFHSEYVVLETGTWRELRRIERDPTTCWAMDFSPDGRVVALSISNQVFELYRADTFEPLVTLAPPGVEDHTSCRFSADGQAFYTADRTGQVTCWDLAAIRGRLSELGLDW